MKILITGSSGYIGKFLVGFLEKSEHSIISFDKSNDTTEDLNNYENLNSIISKNTIDVVIHLAALSGVEKNHEEYYNYFNNNIKGTLNLLESMRKNNIKNILFASSCGVYGNNKSSKEWDKLKPCSFYGLSKVIGEELIKFYGRNHGFSWNIFRIFNVIGRGGESDFNNNRLIPTLINNIVLDQDIHLFLQSNKKETCIRDYVDIRFVTDVFCRFLEKQTNEIINIGSGVGISGQEITNKIFKLLNKKVNIIYSNKRVGDPDKSVSNNKKLEKFGFKYNKNIEEIAKN